MESTVDTFQIGERVCLAIDKNVQGVVIEVLTPVAGMGRYKVFHNGSAVGEYYANQLIPFEESIADTKSFEAFLAEYAARKLTLSSSSSLFSLNAGKIKFIPYQFRPLKKIVQAGRPRLLIADEVGVGKTIETGIIIKEFERRENVESIIIVCPKELADKWQREMRTRFDEPFAILDSDTLDYCLREIDLEGEWPYRYSKCIIGLEMIRREQTARKLMSVEFGLHFDMLVLDEAHHVVNTASNSFAIMEYLADCSDVAVFLSATPIQLKSLDLFALLSLLLPEDFNDKKLFTEMTHPNKHINAAIRNIRNSINDGWQERAALEVECVADSSTWALARYGHNRQLSYWSDRLHGTPLSNEERIACLRDLEDLHSFAHVINRTKRRDIGEFTLREPLTVDIQFSETERAFYEAAHEFELAIYTTLHGALTARMIMATIDRLITSCLPAFVQVLESVISRGLLHVQELSDDIDADDGAVEIKEDLLAKAENLRSLAEQLPDRDAKTEQLLAIISETVDQSEDGKLLVFSFFKQTLKHLEKMVACSGARCAVITGDTDSNVRDELRSRFRLPKKSPNAIDVLLSSEVGCEGLDYEFCSRMVNYDIPWNPMKIEQRIGRIDRFGQKSPKVRIYNFITNGTVEERIFFRCYERLGIFNSTVGDLECVLGNVEADLTKLAFDLNLTESQKAEKAQQRIDNAIRDAEEQREFEANSKELFLMDLSAEDEAVGSERNVQMALIQQLLSEFFSIRCPGSKCEIVNPSQIKLKLIKADKADLLQNLVRLKRKKKVEVASEQYLKLEAFLQDETQAIILDFDGSKEVYSEGSLFVSLSNPLVIMALDEIAPSSNEQEISFKSPAGILEAGDYAFICCEWEQRGYRNSVDINVVVLNLDTGLPMDIDLVEFEKLLLMGTPTDPRERQGLELLDEYLYERQTTAKLRLRMVNEDEVNGKIAILNRSFEEKIRRVQEMAEGVRDQKIKMMRQHQVQNLQASWKERRQELESRRDADILVRRFAFGTIEVD